MWGCGSTQCENEHPVSPTCHSASLVIGTLLRSGVSSRPEDDSATCHPSSVSVSVSLCGFNINCVSTLFPRSRKFWSPLLYVWWSGNPKSKGPEFVHQELQHPQFAVTYRVSTNKHPYFGDVLKIGKYCPQVWNVPSPLQGVQIRA
jgi:hypothetical protein